jgi:hypothetical protein
VSGNVLAILSDANAQSTQRMLGGVFSRQRPHRWCSLQNLAHAIAYKILEMNEVLMMGLNWTIARKHTINTWPNISIWATAVGLAPALAFAGDVHHQKAPRVAEGLCVVLPRVPAGTVTPLHPFQWRVDMPENSVCREQLLLDGLTHDCPLKFGRDKSDSTRKPVVIYTVTNHAGRTFSFQFDNENQPPLTKNGVVIKVAVMKKLTEASQPMAAVGTVTLGLCD